MNLDLQSLVMAGLSAACALLGWLGRQLWDAVQKLRTDLTLLEVQIARDFVRYDRMKDALSPIMDALEDIRKSLQNKADK